MFLKSNIYDSIEKCFIKGIPPKVEPIFEEFHAYLKSIGINIAFSSYQYTNYLTFYVVYTKDRIIAKKVIELQEDNIIKFFQDLLIKYHYDCPKSEKWFAHDVHSFEYECLNTLLRNCKNQIANEIYRVSAINPQYIFADSTKPFHIPPTLLLLYKNKKEAKKAFDLSSQKILDVLEQTLTYENETEFYYPGKIGLAFSDVNTYSYKLFSLVRNC